ncbi:hypothetical protein DXA67_04765 [Bacteroides fragilis]|nr:hypothetical protein DXB57_05360 [Bacteroides fragilis]RGX89430.1 hypothetical protein DXA67_04765 [Bacteroides fragilis]
MSCISLWLSSDKDKESCGDSKECNKKVEFGYITVNVSGILYGYIASFIRPYALVILYGRKRHDIDELFA